MPIHFDHHYASQTEFGEAPRRLCVHSDPGDQAERNRRLPERLSNLDWDEVKLPNPVFEGDTIYSRSELLEKREPKSRPDVGIVLVTITSLNQDGTPIVTSPAR
jgi:itaconyl-CoA hydratase